MIKYIQTLFYAVFAPFSSLMGSKTETGPVINRKQTPPEDAFLHPETSTDKLSESNSLLMKEIEERKKIEKSLHESEDRLRFLAETTKDVLYRLRYEDMKYDYLSPGVSALTGYTLEEFYKIGITNILVEIDFRDRFTIEDVRNLRTDPDFKDYSADYLIRKKNGELIWVGDHSFAWYDNSGKLLGSVGVLQDITKRKESELMLQRQDAILKAVSYQAEVFLKSTDWQENITEVLKRLGEAAGVSRVYIFRNHASDETMLMLYEWITEGVTPQIDKPEIRESSYDHPFNKKAKEILSQNKIFQTLTSTLPEEEKNVLQLQEIKSVLTVPIFVGEKWWGSIGFDDCFEERHWSSLEVEALKTVGDMIGAAILQNTYREELIKAKHAAERSDRLKTDFLTQMSHEIRTPLNTILSYSSLLKEEIENRNFEALPSFFEVIDNGGKRLTRTIDLILNMSQVQTGNLECNFTRIDLAEDIIMNLYHEFSKIAKRKGLEFSFCNDSDASIIVADKYTVTQIFENIIDNAIRFTPSGKISIELSSCDSNISVTVIDTGIGIHSEYLPYLFTPFSQEETGYTRRFDGNGLGLALVKKYVELNNAEIQVKSAKGKGSAFRIVFPKGK
ncbi:MAG: ATP-binding protein [Ignavibacteriales bacterium]